MQIFWRVLSAVGLTTAISFAAAVFGVWIALRGENKKSLDWKLGFAVAILGLGGTISSIVDGLAAQDAEQRIIARIQGAERMARFQPYGIDPIEFVRSLRVVGPHRIDLHMARVPEERRADSQALTERFEWIKKQFTEADWTVSSTFPWPDELENSRLLTDFVHGNDEPFPWVEDLAAALSEHGLSVTAKTDGWFDLVEAAQSVRAAGNWTDDETNVTDFFARLRGEGTRVHLVIGFPATE